ncbi:hydroxyphenylacetyl-CoA thioesterase PaaI [Actinokineospora iranica]|uniref:Acyl-CoA thioesterase n=1 Tax=Actinokineospora iranica TaxID=1271860 RepID=A0A1G6PIJ6_9PSEU|nr:hydroxyphenylacetyl-CoA thioesterase PaaI [Actinokineospora iranica]SDC79394.1 acyl-CoA thioesterase [Actinokineospora iranica]
MPGADGEQADAMTVAARRAEELYATDRTCQSLGITLGEVGPGRASVSMRVTAEMTNGYGIGHGGYVFLLADAAFAYACNSYASVNVAQSAQVTFLRPARVGADLVAEATERERVGRTGLYDVTVRTSDGEVVAEFRGQSQMLSGNPFAGRG